MLTFYHAPRSRSGRVHWLLHDTRACPSEDRAARSSAVRARDPRNTPEVKEISIDHDRATSLRKCGNNT